MNITDPQEIKPNHVYGQLHLRFNVIEKNTTLIKTQQRNAYTGNNFPKPKVAPLQPIPTPSKTKDDAEPWARSKSNPSCWAI